MSDEEVLNLFAEVDEPRTTSQVADYLGISKPATWTRLTDLYDRGLLEKRASSGLRGEAWSISADGQAYLDEELATEEP